MLAHKGPEAQGVRMIDEDAWGFDDASPGGDPAGAEIAIFGGGAIVALVKPAEIVETFGGRREVIPDSKWAAGARLQMVDNVLGGLRVGVRAQCVYGAAGYQTFRVERERLRVAGKPVGRKPAVVVGEDQKTPASATGAGIARNAAAGMWLRHDGKRHPPGDRRKFGVRLEVLAVEDDDNFPERPRIVLFGEGTKALAELTVAVARRNDHRKEWRFAHVAGGLLDRSAANRCGPDKPRSGIPQDSSENGAARKQTSDWRKPRRRSPARK